MWGSKVGCWEMDSAVHIWDTRSPPTSVCISEAKRLKKTLIIGIILDNKYYSSYFLNVADVNNKLYSRPFGKRRLVINQLKKNE